jgi:hypothetical protein
VPRWHATYSLATKFMPSMSGVTIATSARAYTAHNSVKFTPRWMNWSGELRSVANRPLM